METVRRKLIEWSKNQRITRAAAIARGAVLLLVIITCISISMRAHMQKKYSSAVEYAQEQAYQGMIEMTQLFARVEDPNVDVENKLIPSLKAQYTAVTALNDTLVSGFGKKYAVLSQEQVEAFDTAFDEYAAAYREGTATGLAQDDMAECIAGVQEMIEERYKPSEDEIIGTLVTANTPVPEK